MWGYPDHVRSAPKSYCEMTLRLVREVGLCDRLEPISSRASSRAPLRRSATTVLGACYGAMRESGSMSEAISSDQIKRSRAIQICVGLESLTGSRCRSDATIEIRFIIQFDAANDKLTTVDCPITRSLSEPAINPLINKLPAYRVTEQSGSLSKLLRHVIPIRSNGTV